MNLSSKLNKAIELYGLQGIHPAADLMPMMTESEYDELIQDVREHGFLHPVRVTSEGLLIDGRNRLSAAVDSDKKIAIEVFDPADPIQYVISENLKRRHLTTGQRSMIAVEAKKLYAKEAKKRQLSGLKQNQACNTVPVNLPEREKEQSEPEPPKKNRDNESSVKAAKAFCVGEKSVREAEKLQFENPELAGQVKTGELSLNKAVSIAKKVHVSNNSGENEWYTPKEFIDSAKEVMGTIDLDPASSELANRTVKAGTFFTKETDGLKQKWFGNVWLNPPYAQPLISEFSKAISEKFVSKEVNQAIVLVNNATDTLWFKAMATVCSAICFVTGRIKFIDKHGKASGAPLQGQSILYFGKSIDLFNEVFSKYGMVFKLIG